MTKIRLNLRKMIAGIAICLAAMTMFSGCGKDDLKNPCESEDAAYAAAEKDWTAVADSANTYLTRCFNEIQGYQAEYDRLIAAGASRLAIVQNLDRVVQAGASFTPEQKALSAETLRLVTAEIVFEETMNNMKATVDECHRLNGM